MVTKPYFPNQGDIVFLNFNPQSGHEQAGHRPALIVSSSVFYQYTKLAIVCPITNTNKPFPLHIPLVGTKTTGYILTEHIKCLDIYAREAQYVETLGQTTLDDVLDIINGFFEPLALDSDSH